MTNTLNHTEPARMQADVISRRTAEESKLSRVVTEFRVVVLVGFILAAVGSLFLEVPAAVVIGAGIVLGAVAAVALRIFHLI